MNKTSDKGDARKYFAEIPNILCALDLSPFELALYLHLKKTAGADGECWKSTETLAKESKMSAGMVKKAKEELARPRKELNNKALISIREDDSHPGRPRHYISITDIWPENMTRAQTSPREVQSSYSELQTSPHELEVHQVNQRRNQEEKPKEEIKTLSPKATAVSSLTAKAVEAFNYWKEVHGRNGRTIFDAKRRRAVEARLKDGYDLDFIKQAIRGIKRDKHCMGGNEQHKVYDDLELICRDAKHIEGYAALDVPQQTNSPPAIRRCPDCNENGMREVTRDGERGFVKCRHEGRNGNIREAAAQQPRR